MSKYIHTKEDNPEIGTKVELHTILELFGTRINW